MYSELSNPWTRNLCYDTLYMWRYLSKHLFCFILEGWLKIVICSTTVAKQSMWLWVQRIQALGPTRDRNHYSFANTKYCSRSLLLTRKLLLNAVMWNGSHSEYSAKLSSSNVVAKIIINRSCHSAAGEHAITSKTLNIIKRSAAIFFPVLFQQFRQWHRFD